MNVDRTELVFYRPKKLRAAADLRAAAALVVATRQPKGQMHSLWPQSPTMGVDITPGDSA